MCVCMRESESGYIYIFSRRAERWQTDVARNREERLRRRRRMGLELVGQLVLRMPTFTKMIIRMIMGKKNNPKLEKQLS